jgi:hypothetical protein
MSEDTEDVRLELVELRRAVESLKPAPTGGTFDDATLVAFAIMSLRDAILRGQFLAQSIPELVMQQFLVVLQKRERFVLDEIARRLPKIVAAAAGSTPGDAAKSTRNGQAPESKS